MHMSTEHRASSTTSSATPAQFRMVTRYATRSAEAADANQRLVEAVFAELAESRPDNITYLVLRLADDSFVHISFHGHAPDEANPIASSDAFARFVDDHGDRREGKVDQQRASLVGAYVTRIS
jgi:predicted SnoaL-like aldol condensation-catalyzing enzyme